MTDRRLASVGGVVVLLFFTGCAAFGGVTTEAGLAENATYDWETDTDVSIDLGENAFTAVYRIENRSSMDVYYSTRYGIDQPIRIRGVQFRHPNGTIDNASKLAVSETRSRVTVDFPNETGQFAFTAAKRSKQFTLPAFVGGSYEVKVPPDHRVDNVVLGTVRPRGYETTVRDDRVHVRWDDLSGGSITVNYYLQRDVYLFAVLIGVGAVGAAIGVAYVWLQIKRLRDQRREMGLDVDVGDREPPRRRG